MGLAIAQNKQVSGTVFDETGTPIIGASVIARGATSIGITTDINGRFSLTVPESVNTLIVRLIGYTDAEIAAGTNVSVTLTPDAQLLGEVVVTGYGVTRRAAFTGSAQVVTSNDLSRRADANVMKSLEGTVAGLQVNSISGIPGAFAATTIRGIGSMNSGTEPLYVIDGIPLYTDKLGYYSTAGNGDMSSSPISNINPNDIESITVLKDATATSIYGARAANGVIVITTKKGASGRARFNLNSRYGSSFLGSLDHNYRAVNLDRYREIWEEGLINAGYADESDAEGVLNSFISNWFGVDLTQDIESVDWLDEILRTGAVQEHDLSVSGGNESLRYFISGGYFQNEGIIIGTGMTRYSGRVNLEGKNGRIGFGVNANGAYASIDNAMTESQYTNPIVAVYDLRPFEQVRNPDGTFNLDAYYNPVAINDKTHGDIKNQKQTTLLVNPFITVDLNKDLIWKTNAGLSLTDLNEFLFSGRYNPQYNGSGFLGQRNMERSTTLIITNTLNWNQTFNEDHRLGLLAGQEAQRSQFTTTYFSATGFPGGSKELEAAAIPTAASSNMNAATMASFFSRAEYNYQDKYYVSGSFRYDGSSRFGANNRWAPFWSLGARYRLTSESFMEGTRGWLTDFTVRGSYGTVGNQEIGGFGGYYAAQSFYRYGYHYNKRPGAVFAQFDNPDLKWEKGAKANIGFNARLFNRASLEVDFYDDRTKDMIFRIPLSRTTGQASILQNIGEMQNKGVEFLLNANVVRSGDFSWDVRITGTVNRNEILRLSTDTPIEGTTTIRKVGEAFHTFYLPEYAGVDPETGAPQWYKGTEGTELTTSVNEAGQRIVGSADPKFYGGFGMNFAYRGFDFAFDANYTLGNKVFNSGFMYDMQVGHYAFGPVSNYVFENRWQKPGDVTDVPKFIIGDASGADEYTSRFLMNGSYLRLRNMTLGYTLPKNIVNRANIDNLRVYVSAENLFTITASDYIGFDPQTRASGFQSWAYPVPTNVFVGINLGF
jgi:TonB-linked SusC/RagA family outer membrane protein